MITGAPALMRILSAGYLATEPTEDFVPERAPFMAPEVFTTSSCRVLLLVALAEWRRTMLYPRPEGSQLRPHEN